MTSKTFDQIRALTAFGSVRISAHGYDELAEEDLRMEELLNGIATAIVVEDYPNYPKGPCVLVLQRDRNGQPVHALWGIPRGSTTPAVLITAYRPNPGRWQDDFTRRAP